MSTSTSGPGRARIRALYRTRMQVRQVQKDRAPQRAAQLAAFEALRELEARADRERRD